MSTDLIPLAIPYKFKGNEELNEIASEFNILFDDDRNTLDRIIYFMQQYEGKRFNICFKNGINMPIVKSIASVTDKACFRLKPSDVQYIEELKENNVKYFFDKEMLVTDYTNLDAYVRAGVTDVYIGDDLCYNLKDVSNYLEENNIKMRLVLNRIPATSMDRNINPKSPIYRPQDFDLLNIYFDMFEFDVGDYGNENWNKLNVLYKTWFKNQYWHGDLREINEDLQILFPNDMIIPEFTSYKVNCERRCNQRATSSCRKCEQFLNIAYQLVKKRAKFKDADQ